MYNIYLYNAGEGNHILKGSLTAAIVTMTCVFVVLLYYFLCFSLYSPATKIIAIKNMCINNIDPRTYVGLL